jgi:hypothetical protein
MFDRLKYTVYLLLHPVLVVPKVWAVVQHSSEFEEGNIYGNLL